MLWTKSIGRLLGSIENEYPCRAFKHIGNTHFIPSFGFDQINSTSTNRQENQQQFRYQKTYSTQISLNSPHFYGYNVYNETKIKTEITKNTKKHEKARQKRFYNGLRSFITTVYLFMHFVNAIYTGLSGMI